MKKGFSLMEVLVALVIIGVVIATVTPIIAPILSENTKALYKSGFKTVETVVSELVSDISLYPAGNFYNGTTANYFCTNFSDKVNTIGTITCTSGSTIPDSPNFITTNGMRWYDMRSQFATQNITLYVDVNGEKSPNSSTGSNADILRVMITQTGKVTAPVSSNEETYLRN